MSVFPDAKRVELAGSGGFVSASAIFAHKFADVGLAGLVENTVSGCDCYVLLFEAPANPKVYVALGIHGVNQEAVCDRHHLQVPYVRDEHVSIHLGKIR